LVVNDFAELFANHPTITRVYFNGAKAAELYRRLARPDERLHFQRLPSTSPAHATRPGVNLAAWRAICQSAQSPVGSAAQPGEPGRRQS
jgi:G:T/U-mismatch repair DNA glycosylase